MTTKEIISEIAKRAGKYINVRHITLTHDVSFVNSRKQLSVTVFYKSGDDSTNFTINSPNDDFDVKGFIKKVEGECMMIGKKEEVEV